MKILEMLQEDNGGVSQIRVVTFLFAACMATEWLHSVFTTGIFTPNVTSISLVLGALGMKVAQKPFEQKTENK